VISDIDFVILWVDGNDPEWQQEFEKYTSGLKGDKSKSRYRDWDNLKYIFRGFETFTPWVRKIHFVTWGHTPSWLNIDHEKLNIVRHDDFLLKENLPVFNANPIEINLHRIPGVSERFVYFNDDMFLLSELDKDYFFKKGFPRDIFSFSLICISSIAHIKINNIQAINRNFTKKSVLKKNLLKVFNLKYGIVGLYKTLILSGWPYITGFFDHHQPQPFLKSTFNAVWESEKTLLENTSRSRVRDSSDVSQYLFRYWQLCSGSFKPKNFSRTCAKAIKNKSDASEVAKKIVSGKYDSFCINDALIDDREFETVKNMVNEALDNILPAKSKFEL
jgi:hypothetical protein